MRAIVKPNINYLLVIQACIDSIDNAPLAASFNGIANEFTLAAIQYELFGDSGTLFLIPPDHTHKDTALIAGITKKDFTNLYSQQMVARTKPARQYYDIMRLQAPQGICPFCGVGSVKTLDHYLPKSKFPYLSVILFNLVPACRDCNTEKLAILATTPGEQTLHPYYDHEEFISDQWLFGAIEQTVPVVIKYFVAPPLAWSTVSKSRVKKHFEAYGLSNKYSTQAATEISSLLPLLKTYFAPQGPEAVKNYLIALAKTEYQLHKNSWKLAMYQALAESDWFCETGYQFY